MPTYRFDGDTPKVMRGRLWSPGDVKDEADEVSNAEFVEVQPASKAAPVAAKVAPMPAPPAPAKEGE